MPTSPIVASAPERTWIWSDLHLSDRLVLLGWDRPFRSVEEMNRHLLRNWRRRVGADDTIICLGDVAHPDAWRDDRLVPDLAECPGERLLVLGNHDRDVPALRRAGFHKTCRTALCATEAFGGRTRPGDMDWQTAIDVLTAVCRSVRRNYWGLSPAAQRRLSLIMGGYQTQTGRRAARPR